MKKYIFLSLIALAVWGCSSDSNNDVASNVTSETVTSAPTWEVDWTWHDPAPNWQNPADSLYESYMYVFLKLAKDLERYSTDDDRMAIFIGDECRGVSKRTVMRDGSVCFFIMVAGGEDDAATKTTINYYNASLKQVCEMPGFYSFLPDSTIGDTWDIFIALGDGNPKYGWLTELTVELGENAPFTPSEDDIVGVFINGECRGTGRHGSTFVVWGNTDTEHSFQLRYYSKEKGKIYTVAKPIEITESLQNVTINF